jgi:hypothetical protein
MYIPRILWLNLNSRYGLNIKNLIDAAKKYESVECYKNKLKILTYICKNFLKNLDYIDYINHKSYNTINNTKYQDTNSNYIKKKHEIHQILINMQKDCDSELLVNKTLNSENKILRSGFIKDLNSNDIDEHDNQKKLKLYHNIPEIVPNSLTRYFYYNYLTILYLMVRFTYLLSLIGQYIFLSHLIGNEYYKIGIDLFMSFYNQEEWSHIKMFPKITFCEIYIREIGTIHPYLIQCVLRINLLNEIIFLIIWFWLVFLIGFAGLDFFLLFLNNFICCSNCKSQSFALKYLELINNYHKNVSTNLLHEKLKYSTRMSSKKSKNCDLKKIGKKLNKKDMKKRSSDLIKENKIINTKFNDCKIGISERFREYENEKENFFHKNQENYLSIEKELDLYQKFCINYFNNDNIFAFKLIEKNASSLIVSEIIEYLWIYYKKIHLESNKFEKKENEK